MEGIKGIQIAGTVDKLNITSLNAFVKGIDGLTLSQAQAALSTRQLTDKQKEQILISAGLLKTTDSITASEIKQTVAENVLTTAKQQEVLATFEQEIAEGKLSMKRLKEIALEKTERGEVARLILAKKGENVENVKGIAGRKALTASLWEELKARLAIMATNPVAWIVGIVGAGIGLVALQKKLTKSLDECVEELDEYNSAFESAQNEIESLDAELDTCTDRIEELQKLADNGTISIIEQDELDRLKETNEELDRNLRIQKEKAQLSAIEGAESADETLSKTVQSKYIISLQDFSGVGVAIEDFSWVTPEKELDAAISEYNRLSTEIDKLNDSYDNGIISANDYEKQLSNLTTQQTDARTRASEMSDILVAAEQAYKNLENTDGKLTTTQSNNLKTVENANAMYNEFLGIINGVNDASKELNANTTPQNPDEITVSLSITDTVSQINTKLKPALNSLSDAYSTIFEDGFNLDNINVIDVADSIKSELDELSEAGIDIDTSAYENLVSVLSDTESTSEDVQTAFNDLATEITRTSISGAEDFNVLKKALGDLGVANNVEVAFGALARNTEALKEAGLDLSTATNEEISVFASQYVSAENLSDAIQYLTYQKMLNQMADMDTSTEVSNMITLAKNAGITGEVISNLTELEKIYQDVARGTLSEHMLSKKLARADELKSLIEAEITGVEFGAKIDFVPKVDPSDAKKTAKEILESTLAVHKAELDAGIIDLDTYLKKCNDLLNDARDKAIITTAEYWDYQKEVLENQKNVYDKALSAINRRYDKEIDSIEKVINALEKQNEALEKQLAKYDSAVSAITKFLDAQKDLLQDNIDGIEAENDAIQNEIDGYDQLLSAVTLVIDAKREAVEADKQAIQDRIDALREENDEAKRAYELEQAKLDLERLRNSRTKKLYVQGQGYIFDVDHSAIREQEDSVADLELDATTSALEKEQELLDNILEQLDTTEQKWQDIADVFENNKALEKAKELLGDNFKDIILEGDNKSINDILNAYIGAQGKLEDNTLIIEDYEKRMEQLDAIAKKWENVANIKEDTENAINAEELLGKEWQEIVLADRAENYEEFCAKYLEIQSKIDDNISMIESYEEKVEYYENLKQQWSDIADAYKYAEEDMYLTQVLGANAQADLLNGRLDTLEKFKTQYEKIEQAIVDAAWNSANEQNKALASIGSGITDGSGKVGNDSTTNNDATTTTTVTKEEVIIVKKKGGNSSKNMVAQVFHDGIKKGYPDASVPKDKKLETLQKLATEEIPLKNDELPVILRNDELIINTPQQLMLAENFQKLMGSMSAIPWNVPIVNANPLANVDMIKREQPISISIGDIHLHEVQNVDSFADAIVRQLPNKVLQAVHRR